MNKVERIEIIFKQVKKWQQCVNRNKSDRMVSWVLTLLFGCSSYKVSRANHTDRLSNN
jgi:hypothetical protein